MDEELAKNFARLLNTMAFVVGWMVLQLFIGMYLGWAFFGEKLRWQNLAYYLFLAGSFVLLIWIVYRIWNKPALKNSEIEIK